MENTKSTIITRTKTLYLDGVPQVREINIDFGKNGMGLTSEFAEISAIVEEQSKLGRVYLTDTFTDPIDDVYSMSLKVIFDNRL